MIKNLSVKDRRYFVVPVSACWVVTFACVLHSCDISSSDRKPKVDDREIVKRGVSYQAQWLYKQYLRKKYIKSKEEARINQAVEQELQKRLEEQEATRKAEEQEKERRAMEEERIRLAVEQKVESIRVEQKLSEQDPRNLIRRYQGQLDFATSQMNLYLQQKISPQSGRACRHTLYQNDVKYDNDLNMVSAEVLLTWQARDFWRGVPYGECQVRGTILVYMPLRAVDPSRAHLLVREYNKHLVSVSEREHIDMLNGGVTINLR